MARTTKAQIKKNLQEEIDIAFNAAKQRIKEMEALASNPQVALMIEKNKGYMMALEDVTTMLYNRKVF
jgi:hypothetical protein